MKFKEYITEKTKLLGTLKKHEKLLYNAYIDFLKDYYKVTKDVTLSIRKPTGKALFGYIDLMALREGKYKVIIQGGYGALEHIGHEFTHVAQYDRGDFNCTDDYKMLIWKKKEFVLVKDYAKLQGKDFEKYKKVPWEAEAYKQQELLPGLFKESKFLQELKGKDDTLDFLIDNDAL